MVRKKFDLAQKMVESRKRLPVNRALNSELIFACKNTDIRSGYNTGKHLLLIIHLYIIA